jgi:3-hydroxyisobutyrate dehydrogenase-like beta-hydroxyacid dehydrogenase
MSAAGEAATGRRVGFVGVGGMGAGMVDNLLAPGFPVTVLAHRNRAPVEAAMARGAQEAPSPEALAKASDVVILCVRTAEIAEQVVATLRPHLRRNTLVIDCGTSPPETARRLHAALAADGVDFVESPVAGGVRQAAEGALGALVGAEPEALDRARPILSCFCGTIRHFGPPGAGATAKLLNNYLVMGMVALIVETFTKAAEAGVDWRDLYEVALCGAGDSAALRRIIGGAVEGDYRGYVFDVSGALKDVTYYCAMSQTMGGPTQLAEAVRDVFADAAAAGHGDRLLGELLSPEVRSAATWKEGTT